MHLGNRSHYRQRVREGAAGPAAPLSAIITSDARVGASLTGAMDYSGPGEGTPVYAPQPAEVAAAIAGTLMAT